MVVFSSVLLLSTVIYGVASAMTIPESELKQGIKSHIERNMPWEPGGLRIEFPFKISDQELNGKKISWQVHQRQDEDFIGETIFNIRFYDQGIFVRELPVRVKMEASLSVVVSLKPLSRGTVIGREDVKVCQRWYSQYPQDIINDPEEVIGKVLTTQVRGNGEITKPMLKPSRLIRKGSVVKMLAENGSLVVTAMGLSEENGGQGDVIRVKNLSSNKVVYAKVIDQSLVKVDF